MYPYLYLKAVLVGVVVWAVLFSIKKSQRKEMLAMGLIGAMLVPLQELWYTQDYWHPEYIGNWPWIEDMLFGFFALGVSAVIYESLPFKHLKEIKKYRGHPLVFVSLVLLGGLGMVLLVPFMNSIYAASLAFFAAWAIILMVRRDLFVPSIISGLLVMGLSILTYRLLFIKAPNLINAWWELENISGFLVAGIPVEELLWFFTMGLFGGSLYELWKGIGFVKNQT